MRTRFENREKVKNFPLSVAGGSGESAVATFLGGRPKRHRVHLLIRMMTRMNVIVVMVEIMKKVIMIIFIIAVITMISLTFKVDKNGEAPKLRRSSTISTRPAAAASCHD